MSASMARHAWDAGDGRGAARQDAGDHRMRFHRAQRRAHRVARLSDARRRLHQAGGAAAHGARALWRRRERLCAGRAEADFVSLHLSASPDNVHFVNRERLAHLGERAWLINTARGSVVDEAALFAALSERRLGGAALDVFAREPYVPVEGSGDLRALANVILTPHVGSNTVEANRRMAERALQNIVLAEAGAFARMDLINPEVLR